MHVLLYKGHIKVLHARCFGKRMPHQSLETGFAVFLTLRAILSLSLQNFVVTLREKATANKWIKTGEYRLARSQTGSAQGWQIGKTQKTDAGRRVISTRWSTESKYCHTYSILKHYLKLNSEISIINTHQKTLFLALPISKKSFLFSLPLPENTEGVYTLLASFYLRTVKILSCSRTLSPPVSSLDSSSSIMLLK